MFLVQGSVDFNIPSAEPIALNSVRSATYADPEVGSRNERLRVKEEEMPGLHEVDHDAHNSQTDCETLPDHAARPKCSVSQRNPQEPKQTMVSTHVRLAYGPVTVGSQVGSPTRVWSGLCERSDWYDRLRGHQVVHNADLRFRTAGKDVFPNHKSRPWETRFMTMQLWPLPCCGRKHACRPRSAG